MYEAYFGLNRKPFKITPDPSFLYLSNQHRDALAHLLYSTDESSSFILLTGEVGTGKTTLCRSLLAESIEGSQFALILNPKQTPDELLASIADEFGLNQPVRFDIWNRPGEIQRKSLIDQLNQFLLEKHARGEQAVVVIDEAQNLTYETLEQVRLLTNLETGSQKLLKIILIGQPELRDLLNKPELRQLNQRVTARYHLNALSAAETAHYVTHRLKVAGVERSIFKAAALKQLYRLSDGIPRRINLIADRALMGAYAQGLPMVDGKLIQKAAKEVTGEAPKRGWQRWLSWPISGLAGALLLAIGMLVFSFSGSNPNLSENDSRPDPEETRAYVHAIEQDMDAIAASNSPQTMSFDQIMAATANTDLTDTLNSLLEIWGLPIQLKDANHACDQIAPFGLQCFYSTGAIETLRTLNHPAVIEVTDQDQMNHELLISKLNDDQATIHANAKDYVINIDELRSHLTGNFLILWQRPPGGSKIIQPGSTGPDVQWLRAQLSRYSGTELPGTDRGDQFFDEQLKQQLMAFQRAHNLKADGIAGEETLISLASRLDNRNQPKLSSIPMETPP
ncbi:MAG: AAA family ATPase [Thiotrichales bacterium]